MLKAAYQKHTFVFKQAGGTSRGVLTTKDSWHLFVWEVGSEEIVGTGECSIIQRLSIDDRPDFEEKLKEVASEVSSFEYWLGEGLNEFPAIRFGLETALLDLNRQGRKVLFQSGFMKGVDGIPINGLVWMGSYDFMRKQIIEKIEAGFRCVKLKIGAINFEDELKLLALIRKDFNKDEIELRVDANGAFSPEDALEKLKQLSKYHLHSIEQPIRQGQWEQMEKLCRHSPLPIALDEELIGLKKADEISNMLETCRPQFIILKPSLLGGFKQSILFIAEAERRNIEWWVTSALEGNIGLNAIAQWTATLDNDMPQGLGTGQLFTNNIPSPLAIEQGKLFFNPQVQWDLSQFDDAI